MPLSRERARQHRHYCGIDLHVKTMYVCILDAAGQVLVHRNVKSTPEVSPTLKKRRNLDKLSTDGEAAPVTGRLGASSG